MPYGYNGNNNGMVYPGTYQNSSYSMAPQPAPQMSYQTQPSGSALPGTPIWVDGEVGARAWQFPQGWPPNTPVALWDSNDYIIYMKSINSMGIPTPLQKIHYNMEEAQQPALLMSQSGASAPTVNYATKEDLKNMEDRIMAAWEARHSHNENGSGMSQKGGANR